MLTKMIRCGVVLSIFLGAASVGARDEDAAKTPESRCADAVSAVETHVKKAINSRDIALRAAENTVAARNEAEEDLWAAIKGGKKERIQAAKKVLKKAEGDVGDVREMVEDLMEHVTQCLAIAVSVKERAELVAKEKTTGAAVSAVRKAERLVKSAAKAANKAHAIAEYLKKKWLVAIIGVQTTTTTTTTTTTPPPTPIGRR